MIRSAVLAGVVLLVGSAASGHAEAGRKPATHTVTIEGMVFKPAALTIKPGDTVIWSNKDIVEHTATAASTPGFDSKQIAAGKTWKQTFKTKASFDYICKYHPTMKGTLVVK